ncbi:uncharacterized protein LOC129002220 [Macrosteles quadrilineatus]|uniref:uncharacterized protein LOC129002220 n=1 Tax=Macrosteles quadrilineatus TaxID=74068 RepID=UPI0023E1CD05|nr:uncharacterized protein LOC129002220 [Macrosteles quadrilineatus]
MAVFRNTFLCLFLAVASQGFPAPAPESGLPSLLSISSEEELALHSKRWNITPVQMCTLMGHQMTVAQPLLDINHPLVSHLPSIGEMAMSDAVMICEKVLNDAKGRVATVTTIVEETREEVTVPRDYVLDGEFQELSDDLMESMGFNEEDLEAAMEDNQEALVELLEEKYQEGFPAEVEDNKVEEPKKVDYSKSEPSIAEKLGRLHV